VLDEERRTVARQGRRRGETPRHRTAIRSLTLARLDRTEVRPGRPQVGGVGLDVVGGDRPRHKTDPGLRPEDAHRRPPDPRLTREIRVEDTDQLEVRVPKPDQAVVGAQSVVSPATARRQPEVRRQVRRRRVRVGDGDHEVVDPGEHRDSVAGRPARYDARVSPVSNGHVRVERSGAVGEVARVTLARPEAHNAFDATLIAELRATFVHLSREAPTDLRVVVLAGDGPTFCAGADIDWMRAAMALDTEGNEQDAMAMADMFETIDTCPVPVIARVQGAAIGGGMGLCAVADLVIAESGARFGFTETRLGILPSVISPFVIAKIGESHARALFPGGRRFDATRAARIGLVHEIVEGAAALDAAVDAAVADVLAAGPTAARAAKAIVREVRGLGHGSAKWHTARVIARQRTSEEAQEGFRAFLEKRRPAWAPERDEG